MPKFAIKKVLSICGSVQDFYELYIDGVCQFKEFEEELTPQFKSHLLKTYHIMKYLADGGIPPGKKWHKVDSLDGLQEAKYGSMRVYFYKKDPYGKVIVLGSFQKTKQNKDINEAIRLAVSLPNDLLVIETEKQLQEYLSQFKTEKDEQNN